MSQISALIITKNEEVNIGRCIASLRNVADEVVVLDSGSTDRTREIAESTGSRVIETEWKGYAATKNSGHRHCQYDYILSVDADEELSEELAQSIEQAKAKGLQGAYLLDRHNYYLGKWIKTCGWYPDRKIRLYPAHAAEWTGNYVHEQLTLQTGVTVQQLKGALRHHSIQSLAQHKATVNKYAQLAAQKRLDSGKKGSLLKGALAFAATFLRIYFLQSGIIEGKRGFFIAWYSGLSKWKRQKLMIND